MKNKNSMVPYLMVTPAVLLILLFIAYPVYNSFVLSFQHPETGLFTWENYTYYFTDEIQRANIIYTMEIVLITVAITAVVSYALAAFLRFSTSRFAQWMGSLTLLPRFIPGLVAVQSVLILIVDGGVISRIAQWFGMDLSLGWMYTEKAIILMNLWFNIPFSTLILLASLSNVKDSYIESAKDVGSGNWQIFTKIMLPLTYKELIVSMTFVYMSNIGSFTTPYILGGTHPKMLGIVLFDQFNSYMAYERAAALSVIMFALCLVAAAIYIWSNMKESIHEKG